VQVRVLFRAPVTSMKRIPIEEKKGKKRKLFCMRLYEIV